MHKEEPNLSVWDYHVIISDNFLFITKSASPWQHAGVLSCSKWMKEMSLYGYTTPPWRHCTLTLCLYKQVVGSFISLTLFLVAEDFFFVCNASMMTFLAFAHLGKSIDSISEAYSIPPSDMVIMKMISSVNNLQLNIGNGFWNT